MIRIARLTHACLLLAVAMTASLPASHAVGLSPRVIHTRFPTADYVVAVADVTEAPYSARADGQGDAAPAIQAAVDSVARTGGGVVFVPAGRYRCATGFTIREGVTLRGDYLEPDPDHRKYRVAGTILMPVADRGDADGKPFIQLQRGSGVRNLSIWYPDQSADSSTPYPWTIAIDPDNSGDCFSVQQVTLVNSYRGIAMGPVGNEIGTLRHVYGTPLKEGVSADSITDVPRIEHLRFSPLYWSASGLPGAPGAGRIHDLLADNDAIGVELLRVDWYFLFDVDVTDYAVGYHFTSSRNGTPCGVMYQASATGGAVGLKADETAIGFQFANCRFDGSEAAVLATAAFTTELQFNNCRLGGIAKRAIQLDGTGSVRAENCTILSSAGPAIEATAGSLGLVACRFPGAGPQIVLGRSVHRALIATGLSASQVQNHSHGDVQISPTAPASLKPSPTPVVLPPDRRPANALVFDVARFGAKADGNRGTGATDNTAAFQRALDAAGKTGGGTVYVPAGSYRFRGALRVPTGVELRGVFDVPHHTQSWGSTLMPLAGRGKESGTPFLSLAPNSGARGLTFWYPDQMANQITPFPWTVRALGPRCWVIDITTANSYQFVDFGSFPSDGSLLRFVSGAPIRRGIRIGKGSAEVDDGMFNPHYWFRRPQWAPPIAEAGARGAEDGAMRFIMSHLDAFIFDGCTATQQVDNFVYGCNNGLLFTQGGGHGSAGLVINHGSDGASVGMRFEGATPAGLEIVNAEIANVGPDARTAVEIAPSTAGPVTFINGLTWGRTDLPSLMLFGSGRTTLENWSTVLQEAHAKNGPLTIQNATWVGSAPKAVVVDGRIAALSLTADTLGARAFAFEGPHGASIRLNGAEIPPTPLVDRFRSGFEPSDPAPTIRPQRPSGLAESACKVEAGAGRNGGAGLVLTAAPQGASAHGIAYFVVYDVNLPVTAETVLRYWIRPGTAMGRNTGVDLEFTDGAPLRDSGGVQADGAASHPGTSRGAAGGWTMIEVPLGRQAGRTISRILFAFDRDGVTGPVESAVDDIEIGEPQPEVSSEAPAGLLMPKSLIYSICRSGRIRTIMKGNVE